MLVSGGFLFFVVELVSSSSWMSKALSICFCASFRAVLAKLASPAVSNQLMVSRVAVPRNPSSTALFCIELQTLWNDGGVSLVYRVDRSAVVAQAYCNNKSTI